MSHALLEVALARGALALTLAKRLIALAFVIAPRSAVVHLLSNARISAGPACEAKYAEFEKLFPNDR
ncbi:hypothetical protein AKG08_16610 [Achromobacter piechaudii]|nr:hypothetical protein AKG08_16610 [Achromobacter piechaudii]